MLTVPWMFAFPLGCMMRGLWMTAASESNFDGTALGDDGASVGILQFNVVNLELVRRQDWRLSSFWSGLAAVRYIGRQDWPELLALLRPGDAGAVAWRSLWVSGDALSERPVNLRSRTLYARARTMAATLNVLHVVGLVALSWFALPVSLSMVGVSMLGTVARWFR